MTSCTQSSDSNIEQKRRDYRVITTVLLRLRPLAVASAPGAGPDPVALFEDLSLAQARFRKELGPAGRTFVDKLMAAVDALTGLAVAGQDSLGWSDPVSTTADLSAGGLGFVSTSSYDVGTSLDVEFSLPDAGSTVPFRCRAEVVRTKPSSDGGHDCGLSFVDLTSTTQRRLVRVVLELQRVQLRGAGGDG
jgi:hypothetical protein